MQQPILPHEAVGYHLCKSSNESATMPILEFIDDIAAFLQKENVPMVDPVITELNLLHSKYKQHQARLINEKEELERRKPDLYENIALVERMQKKIVEEKEQLNVRFMAADGIWADALLLPVENPKVSLWLGANVMMDYTYEEALIILRTSLQNTLNGIALKEKDIQLVLTQLTTCEVTISRLYNYQLFENKKKLQKNV